VASEADSKRGRSLRNLLLGVVGLLWLAGLGVGLRALLNYEDGPAVAGAAPSTWPVKSRIRRVAGLPTIVVMAHPHCPCTRATIGELALLMARVQNQVSADVVFVRPPGVPEKWEETDLWRDAQLIPGVRVINDPEGVEAARFGAVASGQTMLYDAGGKLLFSGGITAGRGHSGDNAGRSTIVGLITQGKSELKETPVYGCALANPVTRSDNSADDGVKHENKN
jgi:hypothetical protein